MPFLLMPVFVDAATHLLLTAFNPYAYLLTAPPRAPPASAEATPSIGEENAFNFAAA